MKFITVAFFTLLTGALAAPQAGILSDDEKRDVAARGFDGAAVHEVDGRHVGDAVALEGRDFNAKEDGELEARVPKKKKGKGKKGKGKKKAAKAATTTAAAAAANTVVNTAAN
ncbi:hypothetical protein ACCO45_012804 [Purpureocillium lilacinum]|uniref:Uncharacterized protein n=1 Tax=Purpureocillium lilacinum TaxID=33203 RepID=A0ACC4D903_PURLI